MNLIWIAIGLSSIVFYIRNCHYLNTLHRFTQLTDKENVLNDLDDMLETLEKIECQFDEKIHRKHHV